MATLSSVTTEPTSTPDESPSVEDAASGIPGYNSGAGCVTVAKDDSTASNEEPDDADDNSQHTSDEMADIGAVDVETAETSCDEPECMDVATKYVSNIIDERELKIALYNYTPTDDDSAYLLLKAHDLVRVFEIAESGWAAGVKLSKRTKEEIGEAGWFPAAYLGEFTAAEAA